MSTIESRTDAAAGEMWRVLIRTGDAGRPAPGSAVHHLLGVQPRVLDGTTSVGGSDPVTTSTCALATSGRLVPGPHAPLPLGIGRDLPPRLPGPGSP